MGDVRESAPADAVLEKKDLHKIKRYFQISYTTKLHENNAISVKLWAQLMREKYIKNILVLLFNKDKKIRDDGG